MSKKNKVQVLGAETGVRTEVSDTSRTANTVNVLLNVTGQVKVYDVLHV